MSSSQVPTVLEFIQYGAFPSEEDANAVITSADNVKAIRDALDNAIQQIKSEIETLGFENAWNLESYVAEAQELCTNIERSKQSVAELKELSKQQENADEILYKLSDDLETMRSDYARNSTFIEALNKIWLVNAALNELRGMFDTGMLVECVPLLESAENKFKQFENWKSIPVLCDLHAEVDSVNTKVLHSLDMLWYKFIQTRADPAAVYVYKDVDESEYSAVTLSEVAQGLKRYDFKDKLKVLTDFLQQKILYRILDSSNPGLIEIHEEDKYSVISLSPAKQYSVDRTLGNLSRFVRFVNAMFPDEIVSGLRHQLSSAMTIKLIEANLQASVPSGLNEARSFEGVLKQVRGFDKFLQHEHWTASTATELQDWIRRIPLVFYDKKCNQVLGEIRKLVQRVNESERRIVERTYAIVSFEAVERAASAAGSGSSGLMDMMAHQQNDDDYEWEDDWEESKENEIKTDGNGAAEEDDAWGDFDVDFDEEEISATAETERSKQPDDSENLSDPDDWNWGEDDNTAQISPVKAAPAKRKIQSLNPRTQTPRNSSIRKSSLDPNLEPSTSSFNETMVVTSIPEKVLALITGLQHDGDELQGQLAGLSIAPAGLYLRNRLAGLVLSTFRALAPLYYLSESSQNILMDAKMYLSNDCMYLSEQASSMSELGAEAYLLKEMAEKYGEDEQRE
ncbi:uncharacterized protein V1516DRAFT_670973 [Lipomyces oligophaga]|uniref:uncharacterized protein n=1 Tax=Lipomyces oligophaga TaxID=45792 RepID=UPI0034CE76AB